MTIEQDSGFLLPDEPTRFGEIHLNNLLNHTTTLGSSDVTIQTNEHIFAEIYPEFRRWT